MSDSFNLYRNEKPNRADLVYMLLSGIFLGALVLTNVIAGRFFTVDFPLIGVLGLSSGVIAYPITFLATDLISEIFGRDRATLLVKVGFAVSVFATLIVWIAGKMAIDPNSPVDYQSFNIVFGLLPGIVFGSMIAYLCAQYIDVQLFEFWRNLTDGKHLWLRNNASTIVSQLVDTVMVVTIALVIWPKMDGNTDTTAITFSTWQGYVVGQYLFKAAIAALDTPFFYLLTKWLKKWIGLTEE